MDQRDRYRGCLIGLAVGDAVGTTVEFRPPGSFQPLTDMVGGGPFGLAVGQWTDDTSMALCLATSLVACRGFDPRDQMDRYCRWWQDGYLSSNGRCFDIGNTIRASLARYQRTGEPFAGLTDPDKAPNGSIMRLAPVPMYYLSDLTEMERFAADSSRTTHGAPECVDACRLLARIIARALSGMSKEAVLSGDSQDFEATEKIRAIAAGSFANKSRAQVRGSGYVVESLEAALWCFQNSESYRDAILLAANLGDDADTTAAVCGQVAGAYYGESGIPPTWLEPLAMRSHITELADRLRGGPALPLSAES